MGKRKKDKAFEPQNSDGGADHTDKNNKTIK